MKDTNLIDSCQANIPMRYASNILFIRQKCHWDCDWQRAISKPYVQNKGFTFILQESRGIHDSMNNPKIEFISLKKCFAILCLYTDSKRNVVSYKRKHVHEVLVTCLVKLVQEKSVIRWMDRPDMTIAVHWDVKQYTIPNQFCCTFYTVVHNLSLNLYIEDLTRVLMFYWIYLTSWGKEIKCEACKAFFSFSQWVL